MHSNTYLNIRLPKTELTECPITKEKITEIMDPVMFPDGRIYSEKALDTCQSMKGHRYSPICNQEIKAQFKSPGNFALKELIDYTKELKECFLELKQNHENLMNKQNE